jgi:sugar (pentulose or hexulose) kinase
VTETQTETTAQETGLDKVLEKAAALSNEWDVRAAGEELALTAGRDRALLEEARNELVRRLQVDASDFDASRALRVVAKALQLTPRPHEPFTAGPTGAWIAAAIHRLAPPRPGAARRPTGPRPPARRSLPPSSREPTSAPEGRALPR